MFKRKPMKKSYSKSLFHHTAGHNYVHKKNIVGPGPRGGIRL